MDHQTSIGSSQSGEVRRSSAPRHSARPERALTCLRPTGLPPVAGTNPASHIEFLANRLGTLLRWIPDQQALRGI